MTTMRRPRRAPARSGTDGDAPARSAPVARTSLSSVARSHAAAGVRAPAARGVVRVARFARLATLTTAALIALTSAAACDALAPERVFYRCNVEWDCDGDVVSSDVEEACVDREDDITQNATKADAEDRCDLVINCDTGEARCTANCSITEEVCVVDAGT